MTTSGSWRRIDRSAAANVTPAWPVHGDLRDARQLILDRVLDRDDLLGHRVAKLECGVERGRLSAAGRAGDEDHAVRPTRASRRDGRQDTRRHAELSSDYGPAAAIEESEHDTFAEERRHGRHAKIELPVFESDADASVLRPTPFGDIELRQELDARDDGVGQCGRRAPARATSTPSRRNANAEAASGRFEMNVARARVIGVAHEQIDEPDDGRLRRKIANIGRALVVGIGARELDIAARARGESFDGGFNVARARRLDRRFVAP